MTTFSVAGVKLRALASLNPVSFGELVKSIKGVILEEMDSGGYSSDIWERGYRRLAASSVPCKFWGPGVGRAWNITQDWERILHYLSKVIAHIKATSPGFLTGPRRPASREQSVCLPVNNNMQLPVGNIGIVNQRAATVGTPAVDVLYDEFLVAEALVGSDASSQTAVKTKVEASAEVPTSAATPENGTMSQGYLTVVRKNPSVEPNFTNHTLARKKAYGGSKKGAGPPEGPEGARAANSASFVVHRKEVPPPDECKFCDKCAPIILDLEDDQLLGGHLAHVPQTDSIKDLLANNPKTYKLFHVRVFPMEVFQLIFTRGTPGLRTFLKAVRHIFDIKQAVEFTRVTLYLEARDEKGDKLVWPDYSIQNLRDWDHLMDHATRMSCSIGVAIELAM